MSDACKSAPRLTRWGAPAVVLALAACTMPSRAPPPTAPSAAPAAAGAGHRYQLVPAESLMTVRVYRAGALANLGHNHVIASRAVSGELSVSTDPGRAGCELSVPVESFSVDEPQLREAAGADFPAEVPQSARDGTRQNMLGAALLDAVHFPRVTASCEALEGELPDPARPSGTLRARVRLAVRDRSHTVVVPVQYSWQGTALVFSAAFPLRQSDLGLTPYSVMLGALRVQDEMQVQLRLLARPAG